ncbi:hypothetical protein CHS0354_006875 [Potamilus streckersoni]|uniref:Single-stranded DNA-binding protein n=1 Tax=Potamilus streckersoni TaxID=2493646 RepID=A0AAE0WC64_9BIVA|nr:hypothetical protein CHS0354_006875 [Potamilus streckersoni]
MIIGRLGGKPEKRFTSGGTAVATMNVATTEYYTDKANGSKKEKTEWHRIVLWDRLADLADQYLDKGREVYIEGRLQTREWHDKDKIKRYSTEIIGTAMQFIGGAGQGDHQQSPRSYGNNNNQGDYGSRPQSGGGQFGNFGQRQDYAPPGGGVTRLRRRAMTLRLLKMMCLSDGLNTVGLHTRNHTDTLRFRF